MKTAQTLAATFERSGAMSRDDFMTLARIQLDVADNRKLSDADIEWLSDQLRKPPSKTSVADSTRMGLVVMTLDAARSFSPQQKKTLTELASYLISKSQANGTDSGALFAMRILIDLKDPGTVPLILPFVDDKRREIQQMAKMALKASGYTAPVQK